ncbi:MAG: hypothetical protein JKX99_03235 [Robiginitomaculum sp.]|nr:hypothetical protein [Robiginitomaculum sp.]
METLNNILILAFGPGDIFIFLMVSAFVGLMTGRFSRIWLAVLLAALLDSIMPGVIEMLDGADLAYAHAEIIGRIVEDRGVGLLARALGYFVTVTGIILLKKGLGN